MLIKLETPGGQIEKVRIENLQYYLNRGYKRIIEPETSETVELMSPAGKVVVLKQNMYDYLNREGWSLLVEEISTTNETPETSEIPVEDEISEVAPELAVKQEPEPEPEAETELKSESVELEEIEETQLEG